MHIPTIGLEIHVELKTKTKMFCRCLNDPEEKHPNQNVCPVCLGHPGNLPVANNEAILAVLKTGLALGGNVAEHSHFDRKSYFYPDLPKAYQISQYEEPLIEGGKLNDIRIRRIHLEEDTARLLHELPDYKKDDASFVDFNRAGVPLMELVTETDVKNAEEAVKFAGDLQLILRYLGISQADMEKGQLRVEANISLSADDGGMGTKVEVKNINSFRAVHDAIEYELKRQEQVLKDGKKIIQETRGWDERKSKTVSQRSKESAHDYRYFPEPDLPPLNLKELDLEALRDEIPELPEAKAHRFIADFGLARDRVWTLISEKTRADYFEKAASELASQVQGPNYQMLSDYIAGRLAGLMSEKQISFQEVAKAIPPEHLSHLVSLIMKGTASATIAQTLLPQMLETGEDPETLMNKGGISIVSDVSKLEWAIKEVLAQNPKAAADYKKGKTQALQFLFGEAMAQTRGQADPKKLRELLEQKLK